MDPARSGTEVPTPAADANAEADVDADGNAAADAPGDATACVVAVRPATFERCRTGRYPSPRSYGRARRPFEYLALYRTAPVSAVTHYAPVLDRVEQARGGPGPMDATDWAATVDPFSGTDRIVVFELGDLVPLAAPIRDDATGVRGAWYCTVTDLRAATTVSELAARAGAD